MEISLSDNLLFTIIIPTYNRADLVMTTINSVLNQTFISFEILLVDDGSTDNTEEVVKQIIDPRFKYFKKQNAERGAARNFGIQHAKGQFVTFCDSDDIIFPEYFSNANQLLKKHGLIPWFHLAYEIRREVGQPIRMTWMEDNFIEYIAKGNPLSCMGVFVRRDILEEYPFNENRHLAGSEDWELWLRLAARYPIVFDSRIVAALLFHKDRSVINTNELKLSLRKYLSIGYAFDDVYVQQTFSKYRKIMEAYFDTYISLHLLLAGSNKKAIRYLFYGFAIHPGCIVERRFLAIIKHLLINITTRPAKKINY
jgi:glycosyltransferase involved in cell wall biosynthesis